MTTIIRLNTNFNNPNLPTFLPLPYNGLLGAWMMDGAQKTIKGTPLSIVGSETFLPTHLVVTNRDPSVTTNIIDEDYAEMTMVFIGNINAASGVTNNHCIGDYGRGHSLYIQPNGGVRYAINDATGQVQVSVNNLPTTEPTVYFVTRTADAIRLRIPSESIDKTISLTPPVKLSASNIKIAYGDNLSAFDVYGAAIYGSNLSDDDVTSFYNTVVKYFSDKGVDLS